MQPIRIDMPSARMIPRFLLGIDSGRVPLAFDEGAATGTGLYRGFGYSGFISGGFEVVGGIPVG